MPLMFLTRFLLWGTVAVRRHQVARRHQAVRHQAVVPAAFVMERESAARATANIGITTALLALAKNRFALIAPTDVAPPVADQEENISRDIEDR